MFCRKQPEKPPVLPNFLIVGAAKSGTSSLYEYLRQHPDVFMPKWKELSFFLEDPYPPIHKVKKPWYYRKVFEKVENQTAVGEASTSYLYEESAPRRIKAELGLIKIIIVLRNPVEMAYSLYNHQVRKEGEISVHFEAALDAEDRRITDLTFRKHCYGWHANYYYFHRGLYYEQVKRYLDTFGQGNVLIFLFEELVKDPVQVARTAFSFLDVDDTFAPVIKIHNPGGGILKIPNFWQDVGLFYKTTSFLFSRNALRKIPHLIRNLGRKPAGPIDPTTAGNLKKRYYDEICRLEQLIGRDLSAWK